MRQNIGFFIALLLFFATAVDCLAQDPISTERPSQSNSGYVMTPGRLNLETGFQFQRTIEGVKERQLNTTLLRYGINEFFEVRASFNYQQLDVQVDGADESGTGFTPFTLGVKVKLLEEDRWIPQMALTSQITLPGGEEVFNQDNVVPNIRMSAQWSLGSSGALYWNQGLEWSDVDSQVTNAYTVLYAHAVLNDLTWFLESYGFFGGGTKDHRADTGFAFLITDRIQVDAFGGMGLSDESPDWFAAGGISFAFLK